MRKLPVGLVLGLLVVTGSTALAVDSIGPPMATLNPGEFAVALETNYSERVLNSDFRAFAVYDLCGYPPGGGPLRVKGHTTLKGPALTLRVDYSPVQDLDVFARIGVCWKELEGLSLPCGDLDLGGEGKPTVGVGLRVTIAQLAENVYLGANAQINCFRLREDARRERLCKGWPTYVGPEVEAEFHECSVGLGVSAVLEPVTVYGGVFASWLTAETDIKCYALSGQVPAKLDLEPEGFLGVFFGTRVPLAPRVSLTFDGHVMDGGWGVGAAIAIVL